MNTTLSLDSVYSAHARIKPYVNRTPILTSGSLNKLYRNELYFKCENFQKVGAFKARGAHSATFILNDKEARAGVVTHSSGNHAAALALAAKNRGIPAFIVMPKNAPQVKKASVERYGGLISFCEPTLEARESTAQRISHQTGAQFIHPYNDLRVIAGQGTVVLEMFEEIPTLDIIVCPIGGGGLMSGTAFTAKKLKPNIIVIGAEPENADDAYRSFYSKRIVPSENPKSIADGLLTSLGTITFPIIRDYVDDIIRISEDEIIRSVRKIWEIMKIIIEPSAAVSVAAVLENKIPTSGKRIGVIITGGNIDFDKLPWQR